MTRLHINTKNQFIKLDAQGNPLPDLAPSWSFDPNLPQQIQNPDQETDLYTDQYTDPDTYSKPDNHSVFFFSNHKDLSFLKKCFPDKEIVLIPHPLLKPTWTEAEIRINCASVISKAVHADVLIINGDYFLVALILQARLALGKITGFVACEKLNRPDPTILNGIVSYSQSLKPIGLRWIKPQKDQISEWLRVQLILDMICTVGLSVTISSCQNGWQVWTANINDKKSGLKVQAYTLLGAMELLSSQVTQLTINGYLK